MKKPTALTVGFFMSAALRYIPLLLFYLSNLYSLPGKTVFNTRIIATVSKVCKDFFRFSVDNRKPWRTVILPQCSLVFRPYRLPGGMEVGGVKRPNIELCGVSRLARDAEQSSRRQAKALFARSVVTEPLQGVEGIALRWASASKQTFQERGSWLRRARGLVGGVSEQQGQPATFRAILVQPPSQIVALVLEQSKLLFQAFDFRP